MNVLSSSELNLITGGQNCTSTLDPDQTLVDICAQAGLFDPNPYIQRDKEAIALLQGSQPSTTPTPTPAPTETATTSGTEELTT